jgi:hypothetical protein
MNVLPCGLTKGKIPLKMLEKLGCEKYVRANIT